MGMKITYADGRTEDVQANAVQLDGPTGEWLHFTWRSNAGAQDFRLRVRSDDVVRVEST